MMTVFVGLILFMIVVFMIVNGSFLEKYYISNKKSEFIKAYTMVQEGVENNLQEWTVGMPRAMQPIC